MLPIVLLSGVEPIAPPRPLLSGRDRALRLLPQLDPGDILSARVEAKLPDGSYKVLIAGQALRMALPSHLALGDQLELAFLAREPRLTFLLKDVAPSGSAPAPQLSAAGRLVAATMLHAGEPAPPLTASAAAPLLATPPAEGARMSSALAQALAQSGLFYESHQAQWATGRRALAQIRQEPQARLTRDALDAGATGSPQATAASEIPAALNALRQEQSIDARTVHLVQQQLAALDSAKVVLQLEIWPGQWMQWEVDDAQRDPRRAPHETQTWTTELRLDLPQLGRLRAALALAADGVHISLAAGSAGSAEVLRKHSGSLHNALAAAGVPPAAIAVAHHEQG